MIVYDLECREPACSGGGHSFEGWFASSQDFSRQQERGLLTCPHCGSAEVGKAMMAPYVGRKGNQLPIVASPKPDKSRPLAPGPSSFAPLASAPLPPEATAMMQKLATMQAEALKASRFVGDSFAEDARAMHYGEREHEVIHGQATIGQAKELLEEGITVAPLPFPFVPPEQAN